jgi:glycosyltransferase involved in cell wall biosynthesis
VARTDLTVSVITPSFNQGRFIETTIRSVLEQEGPPVEYVVIDGGSSDETVSILERFDSQLSWVSEPDDGQAHAVNKGLDRTSGDIIGWLNSDDIYYPGAIRAVQGFFRRHPEVDVVYGDGHHIDTDGRIIEAYYTESWDPLRLEDVCFLCQPTVFFRRSVVDRCGGLDAGLQYCMDYEYWIRLSIEGMRFGYLRRYLAGSRLYADTKTLGHRVKVHAEINHMLRSRLRRVPDRWLGNYAHVVIEEAGLDREKNPLRFALNAAGRSWLASLRWNRRLSRNLARQSWSWIRSGIDRANNGGPPSEQPSSKDTGAPCSPRAACRRIGFDVSQTGADKAGCGWVADSLIQHLTELDEDSRYRLYRSFGGDYWGSDGPDATRQFDRSNVLTGIEHATHREARSFWRNTENIEAALGYPDLVHSNNFYCPTGLGTARLVYTLYDLHFLDHPEWTTETNRQTCFEGVFAAATHADMVLAISQASKDHFLRVFPHYPEERVEVVHLACRLKDRPGASTPPSLAHLEGRRFLLNVGTLEPRKNQLRLIEAFASITDTGDEPLSLVMAGGPGWLSDEVEDRLNDKCLEDRVVRLGYVGDDELVWLYRNCFAFVYPSLAEGFGLPVIEAASQGAPVIASKVPVIEEVVGDSALLVDPLSPTDIRTAIERLVDDEELRRGIGEAGLAHADEFTWKRSAGRVLELYDAVLDMEKYRNPARTVS